MNVETMTEKLKNDGFEATVRYNEGTVSVSSRTSTAEFALDKLDALISFLIDVKAHLDGDARAAH